MTSMDQHLIVADIGGTNARFGIATSDIQHKISVGKIHVYRCADFNSFNEVLARYFSDISPLVPTAACIAIAAPLSGDQVSMTNLNWQFSIAKMADKFHLQQLEMINDFTAQACAIEQLSADTQLQIKTGKSQANKPIAILGPGTGLGVAILNRTEANFQVISTQGGHVSLAAETAQEVAIIRALRKQHAHVSAELVLSGNGLIRLFKAMENINDWSQKSMTASEITSAAIDGNPECIAVVRQFCQFLAGFSADLALSCGATGGVYLTGGIAPKIREFILEPAFNQRFTAKGAMAGYLANIPIHMITHTDPALIGSAVWMQARNR